MKPSRKTRIVRWTEKNVLTEAMLHRTVYLWQRLSPKSVAASIKMGLYDLCVIIITKRHYDLLRDDYSVEHGRKMEDVRRDAKIGRREAGKKSSHAAGKRSSWQTEDILRTVLPCESLAGWKAKEPKAYRAARRRGLLPIIAQMLGGNREPGVSPKDLTSESLLKKARETGAKTWRSLRAENRSLYEELRRRVLEDGLVTPLGMPRGKAGTRRWTEASLHEVARSCTSLRMLTRKAPGATGAARRLGIKKEIVSLYFSQTKSGAKLTTADCIESASNYETFAAWVEGDRQAAIRATRRGWLEECCYHMAD